MPRNKRPAKRHKPRLAAIPLCGNSAGSIAGQFRLNALVALTVLQSNTATADNLDQLAQILNVLYIDIQTTGEDFLIESGMRALQTLCDMQNQHGKFTCSEPNYHAIRTSTLRALEQLNHTNVTNLYLAQKALQRPTQRGISNTKPAPTTAVVAHLN